jgi:hypothetical protein
LEDTQSLGAKDREAVRLGNGTFNGGALECECGVKEKKVK